MLSGRILECQYVESVSGQFHVLGHMPVPVNVKFDNLTIPTVVVNGSSPKFNLIPPPQNFWEYSPSGSDSRSLEASVDNIVRRGTA